MGGPRASSVRQIARGQRCYRCGALLPDFLKPGARGERACPEACRAPGPTPSPSFRILCNVDGRQPHAVHFVEGLTGIGPWLLCEALDEVERILRWGHATPEEHAEYANSISRWGVSSVSLRLTRMQRASLVARRSGWPWNGYELLQMYRAGRYPPQRLTPREEEAFLRNRRP